MSNFIIVSLDNEAKTMVIDWGYVRQNHSIPSVILDDPTLTKEEVSEIIETMRPERLAAIAIPQALQDLLDQSDQVLSQQLVDNEVIL